MKSILRRLGPILLAFGLALLYVTPALFAPPLAQASDPSVETLLKGYDDMLRGDSSDAVVTMNIKTKRWERSMTMRIMSKGKEKSLIQILAPAKDKGTTTLKVDDNLWNYLPKVDRTIKLPAAMMSSSWMGSHFTNDDLVRESRVSEDFDSRILQRPGEKEADLYVLELIPKPDTPVVWGKILLTLRGSDLLPVQVRYFDEKGQAVRTMDFSEFKEMSGRMVATKMRLTPEEKSGEFTEIIYEKAEFNKDIPDSAFTLQALKR